MYKKHKRIPLNGWVNPTNKTIKNKLNSICKELLNWLNNKEN
jgi:hypothetical protein